VIHILKDNNDFPDPNEANSDGLLAVGGRLDTKTLIKAYKKGIFPWFDDDADLMWWSPNPRFVLEPHEFRISKSFGTELRQLNYHCTYNKCFDKILSHCQNSRRKGQEGTWITEGMCSVYMKLHDLELAKSVEVWDNDKLIGGLYGVLMPPFFFGESMFSIKDGASKFALHHLCVNSNNYNIGLIDCQVYTRHLETLGAKMISRLNFLALISVID